MIDFHSLTMKEALQVHSVNVTRIADLHKKKASIFESKNAIWLNIVDIPEANWASGCGERVVPVVNNFFKKYDENNYEFVCRFLTDEFLNNVLEKDN